MMMERVKIPMIVCLEFMVVMVVSGSVMNHNGAQHEALCNLLQAAVNALHRNKGGDALNKALKQTIFGNESGGDIDTLRSQVPTDYDESGGERGLWCGEPFDDEHQRWSRRWSGHSAPHGLVCLCTLGANGWPLSDSNTENTLCGQLKSALGGGKGKGGWSGNGNDGKEGNQQITATWTTVAKPCLDGGDKTGDLKKALEKFIGQLNHTWDSVKHNIYLIGEGNVSSDNACDGTASKGVCARYFPNLTSTKTWWSDLEKALIEEEQAERERELAEKKAQRKQKEQAARKDEPHTPSLSSAHPSTNQTEQSHKDSLHEEIRKYNMTSGTPISRPSSWLLSAAMLI
ncbi:Variant surface glycoprotein [Trypanosoma congolense IL3000]|uniref:Variant surface glycoprotein n=1 Tax=Trypanosoma congolense (strain IL3000) TaxID=1068625 RepID=F9WJK0_TRYCI|nr:Variant surface glycoprotein [Trypanosoma congolense IL3000]